jgi:hypothetical protein
MNSLTESAKLCWAALTNTGRANSQIDDDLDELNWNMVGAVNAGEPSRATGLVVRDARLSKTELAPPPSSYHVTIRSLGAVDDRAAAASALPCGTGRAVTPFQGQEQFQRPKRLAVLCCYSSGRSRVR